MRRLAIVPLAFIVVSCAAGIHKTTEGDLVMKWSNESIAGYTVAALGWGAGAAMTGIGAKEDSSDVMFAGGLTSAISSIIFVATVIVSGIVAGETTPASVKNVALRKNPVDEEALKKLDAEYERLKKEIEERDLEKEKDGKSGEGSIKE